MRNTATRKIYHIKTLTLAALFAFVLLWTCPLWADSGSAVENERIRQWKIDLKAEPLPKDAVKLEHLLTFPGEKSKQDAFLRSGTNLIVDSKNNVYVSDSHNHSVCIYNKNGELIKKLGRKGKGPGDLLAPCLIALDPEENLVVYETGNSRLQVLAPNGTYRKSFRLFEGYSSMFLDKDGLIFCSPFGVNKPLVRIFDHEGKLKNSFGHRLLFKKPLFGLNKVFMSRNDKGEIYVAWELFPLVRRYTPDFKLDAEFRLKREKMVKNAGFNRKSITQPGETLQLKMVIAGLRATDDGFYIISFYPRIEILEYDRESKLRNYYWAEQPYDLIVNDFYVKVQNRNGKKEKLFYVLQAFPDNVVSVFRTGNAGPVK